MSYQLLDTADLPSSESAFFIEGAMLAANMTCQPLSPATWQSLLFNTLDDEAEKQVMSHYQHQYDVLAQPEHGFYALLERLTAEDMADFAEGFMTIWPVVEAGWLETDVSDGTQRMLQGLLTTWMLAIDETQTHQEMLQAGLTELPSYKEMAPNLPWMIQEVFASADAALTGHQGSRLNPYKSVSRNDTCPCGSGKKFKHCCLN
ncbi:SEC-C metal-binding domain-containing protein [Vibrio aerogenes]|nr:SEC-C metal-binding domain-containing protein [Vibrio aerogenes]